MEMGAGIEGCLFRAEGLNDAGGGFAMALLILSILAISSFSHHKLPTMDEDEGGYL